MTCIIGLVEDGVGYIAADSCGSDGYRMDTYKAPKAWKKKGKAGTFLFGVSGSYLTMQILRHNFEPPQMLEGQEPDEYMVTRFIPDLKAAFKAGGADHKDKEDGEETCGFTSVIVVFRGKVFQIQNNYSVLESDKGYDAIGSGTDYAKGCLFGNGAADMEARERILRALQCAETYVTSVRGPFTIVSDAE